MGMAGVCPRRELPGGLGYLAFFNTLGADAHPLGGAGDEDPDALQVGPERPVAHACGLDADAAQVLGAPAPDWMTKGVPFLEKERKKRAALGEQSNKEKTAEE
jgi:hypothetical protein